MHSGGCNRTFLTVGAIAISPLKRFMQNFFSSDLHLSAIDASIFPYEKIWVQMMKEILGCKWCPGIPSDRGCKWLLPNITNNPDRKSRIYLKLRLCCDRACDGFFWKLQTSFFKVSVHFFFQPREAFKNVLELLKKKPFKNFWQALWIYWDVT